MTKRNRVSQPPLLRCLVTAGPTIEPLDEVRRLTNFSTGQLGTELANHLTEQGHRVILLLGSQATWPGPRRAWRTVRFTTSSDLQDKLKRSAPDEMDAVFHTAAVSDFAFGKVWRRTASGRLRRVRGGKISSRQGTLLAELRPTPKILGQLRTWLPRAYLVGWKYEVEGGRAEALASARRQLQENLTDACVVNGPAYGAGFGLMTKTGPVVHRRTRRALFTTLASLLRSVETRRVKRSRQGAS